MIIQLTYSFQLIQLYLFRLELNQIWILIRSGNTDLLNLMILRVAHHLLDELPP
ncbi:hypothetical protein Hanom_Chr00s000001g01594501 [Helianthus anomalus]